MHSKLLLGSGVAAGVLMPGLILADGATRPGYNLWHHGASQLGTGERWWLLTLTFVIGGLLLIAFAAGLRRALHPGKSATWGPVLTATAGVALVLAGVIPTDPALGYPPGQPEVVTAAGRIHGLIGLVLFVALSAAAFVLARRLRETSRGWALYSRLSGILVIVLAFAAGIAYRLDVQGTLRPAPAGLLEHASLLVGFCWIVAIGVRLSRTAR
ncbi:DUF998 domain-containing protein [Thermoactinospora rubra]|uniref:DUF998 domain-containing protein n=1 Tax=Thermoactinospora rubra TaxID=1088767 RepID=UPI000A106823|nr:DUF998 domain-containing protein [Thermoactinospora rubra]